MYMEVLYDHQLAFSCHFRRFSIAVCFLLFLVLFLVFILVFAKLFSWILLLQFLPGGFSVAAAAAWSAVAASAAFGDCQL